MLFAATPDLYDDDAVLSIPGTPPRLDRPVTGCAFAPRCDRRAVRCEEETPESLRIGADREAACHFAADQVEVSR